MIKNLIDKLIISITDYLVMQAKAGADVLMIFDSWGGLLNSENYLDFSLNPMQEIIEKLRNNDASKNVPIILFTKGGGSWLKQISASGCSGIGLDWTTNIKYAREIIGEKICIQGNLDPCALHGTEQSIKEAASRVIDGYGYGHRHIFNLGHGIDQFVKPEKLAILIDHVKDYSSQYHKN